MGSWSVYCNISNISITSGRKCVFLALKENELEISYLPYLPAILPIFGEYDDYGGIENIEENENTKLIEKHFKCSIHDFCYFFTRGCIDERDVSKKLSKNEEIKDWKFMFIDRQVYDFMSSHIPNGYGGRGHLEYGNPKILELIGFTYIGENIKNNTDDPKRYKYEWELDGKKFHSDGTWLHCGKNSVHNFTGNEYSNLTDYVKIPEDKMWIGEKAMWELWSYLEKSDQSKQLFWIVGKERSDYYFEKMMRLGDKPKLNTLLDKYLNDVDTFGKWLCELVTIRHNLHCMSGYFSPHILYLTPQCGEVKEHQVLLEKFAEINKTYINPEDEE